MQYVNRFPVGDLLSLVGEELDSASLGFLQRAELPLDVLGLRRPATAQEYFAIWTALDREFAQDDIALRIARARLSTGFDSGIYALCASHDVKTGLQRLAHLTSLSTPVKMGLLENENNLAIRFQSLVDGLDVPPLLGCTLLISLVEAVRHATGEHIRPIAAEFAQGAVLPDALRAFAGSVTTGPYDQLVLSQVDASRRVAHRLVLFGKMRHGLESRYKLHLAPEMLSARVRHTLIDVLAGGQATAAQVAAVLSMSKRSMQRQLSDEGHVFQGILDDTRAALALTYLANSTMRIPEIAYLLGYGDVSSFFRAFRNWTGQTPEAVRKSQ